MAKRQKAAAKATLTCHFDVPGHAANLVELSARVFHTDHTEDAAGIQAETR